jgi:hypothetical protein
VAAAAAPEPPAAAAAAVVGRRPRAGAGVAAAAAGAGAAGGAGATLGVPAPRRPAGGGAASVRLCASGLSQAEAGALQAACAGCAALRAEVVDELDGAGALVTPGTVGRTEKLALAAVRAPFIVTLAYVQRCAAAGAWQPVAAADVPALQPDGCAPLDLAAVLRARGPLPVRPLAGRYFGLASQFAHAPAHAPIANRIKRLVAAGGGTLEATTISPEFAQLHRDTLVVIAAKDDAHDRASRGLAALGVLYAYGLVVTALARNCLTREDLDHYRIVVA